MSGPLASLQHSSLGTFGCPNSTFGGGNGGTGGGGGGGSTSGGYPGSIMADIFADTSGYEPWPRPNQWLAQYNAFDAARIDSTLTDSFPTYQRFMVSAAGSRFEWLSDIDRALIDGDTTLAGSLLNSPVQSMGRVVVDTELVITDIGDADPIVDKMLIYYNEYLNYSKGNALDTAEILTLADLCPALYGGVVYKARGLYKMISGETRKYDDDGCILTNTYRMGREEESITSKEQAYSLSPNPNEGSFILRQANQDKEVLRLSIYNMQGQIVLQKELNFSNGKAAVQMINAVPGTYLINLRSRSGKTYNLKTTVK